MPIGGKFNAANQVWRGLEADADFSREGFVERVLYGRALVRRQVEGAAHRGGAGSGLESLAEGLFRRALHFPQAAGEDLAEALFQAHRGEIGQRLSCDGEHFPLCAAADCLM